MKKYLPKLVDGTEDHYKIYVDNMGKMLGGDQYDMEMVSLSAVHEAIKNCEGDIDFLKFILPKLTED